MIVGGSSGFLDAALVPVLTVIARLPASAVAPREQPGARDLDDRKFGANGNEGWRIPSRRIDSFFGRQKFHPPAAPTGFNAEPRHSVPSQNQKTSNPRRIFNLLN